MANERGMLVGKQLEARRMMRQPTDVFGGTAHQAVWLADEAAMQASAQGLDKAANQEFRRGSFEKTHAAIVAEIPDEESG